MSNKKTHDSVKTFHKGPKDMECKGAIPKTCQVAWKQMFHVAKVVTDSEQGSGAGNEETVTPPLPFSLMFSSLKPRLDLLFGSRSRRGQRKSQCISISCRVSGPMSVELNLE